MASEPPRALLAALLLASLLLYFVGLPSDGGQFRPAVPYVQPAADQGATMAKEGTVRD